MMRIAKLKICIFVHFRLLVMLHGAVLFLATIGVFHFELLHAWGCHYDVIIGPDDHLPPNPPPIPQPQVSYITL